MRPANFTINGTKLWNDSHRSVALPYSTTWIRISGVNVYWPRPSPPGGGPCGPAAPGCRRPGTWSPGRGPPEPPAARRWRWCGVSASCGSAAGWGAAARFATGCSCSCRTSSGAGPEKWAPSPGCRSLHGGGDGEHTRWIERVGTIKVSRRIYTYK